MTTPTITNKGQEIYIAYAQWAAIWKIILGCSLLYLIEMKLSRIWGNTHQATHAYVLIILLLRLIYLQLHKFIICWPCVLAVWEYLIFSRDLAIVQSVIRSRIAYKRVVLLKTYKLPRAPNRRLSQHNTQLCTSKERDITREMIT